jgi:hypothetical protein
MVDMWSSSSLYLCHTKGARHMSEVAEITGGLGFKRTSQVIASSWVSLWWMWRLVVIEACSNHTVHPLELN